jgi:uncharacterized membrane protein YkvA (DUF1232 family)
MIQSANSPVDDGLWPKIKAIALHAGREAIEKALILYFAAQRPETPVWAKTVIYSALAYLVLPTDAMPDFIPFTGFVDDLGTLAAAVGAVAVSITPEVKAAAKQKVRDWLGDEEAIEEQGTPQANDAIREIQID